ncbi:MAG: ATP-binding protein, partial [Gammaproteobacteria bacterium]|nr:ATP-binding protein [Gammaproteobacteria bacterium]
IQNYLDQNMRYLLSLRTIAIAAQVLALLFMHFSFSLQFPVLPVMLIILGLGLYTGLSFIRLRSDHRVTPVDIQIQLVIDIIALTLLVYFTGGSTNPFIFFFLLPITFAAATLNFRQACLIAGIAAVSYTALMFFHVPVLHHNHDRGFDLHIWGMWYGFLISSGLLTYYVSRIGLSIRRRDRALARAREETLKSDQVLALGTLAAGTAHELGTPLATMAILTREMQREHADKKELLEDLKLLRQQIDRCKSILSRMAMDAGQTQAESGRPVSLDEYLQNLLDDWKSLQPDQLTETSMDGPRPAPEIISDTTLGQAIHNVLNNAANACRESIVCNAHWDESRLTMTISDDGPGVNEGDRSGPRGLGIGLFLSRITLNRLGGDITLGNRPPPEHGTRAVITLPLEKIRIAA